MDGKYVILELIPEAKTPDKGNLVQLSALKLNRLELIDRFDYRLDINKVTNPYVKEMVKYDVESFNYVDSSKKILSEFKKFIGKLDLVIIDNDYTNNYLSEIKNKKVSISQLLNMDYSDEFIDEVIKKYNLEPSNYIVDLLYEALIYESNNKN